MESVTARLNVVQLRGLRPELIPLVEVSAALVRGCLDNSRGVLTLAEAGEYGGSASAERSAWEAWYELKYLLLTPDPPRDAARVQVNALLQVIELLEKRSEWAAMLEKNQNALAIFETTHPDVVAEVRTQRKKDRRHWSGRSRTTVVAPTEPAKDAYKALSWETHPDVASIRDVSAVLRDGIGYLNFRLEDNDAAVERSASSASECLLRAWNAFAQSFGQKQIEGAPPRKPG